MGRPSSYYAHCSLRKEGGQPLHPGVRGHLLPRQRRCLLRRLAPCPPPVGLLLQPSLDVSAWSQDGQKPVWGLKVKALVLRRLVRGGVSRGPGPPSSSLDAFGALGRGLGFSFPITSDLSPGPL